MNIMTIHFPFLGALASILILCTSCSRKPVFGKGSSFFTESGSAPGDFGQIYRKSNLELLLLGRNRWEVQEVLGPPEGKSLTSQNEHLWDFRRSIEDEETGEVYDWSLISMKFSVGKCTEIKVKLQHAPSVLVMPDP